MKKSIQIQIPEPCHENWDKMTAANQGRFCNACSKVVVDFSMMSDKEILNYISNTSSKMCGRVGNEQLNRPIQMPVEKRRISFKYLWSMLISTFLVSYKTQAQGEIKLDSIVSTAPQLIKIPDQHFNEKIVLGGIKSNYDESDVQKRILVKGRVLDENGNPIPSATVSVENSKFGKVADSKGRFNFKIPSNYNGAKITVSSIGYETVSLDLNDEIPEPLNIVMKSSHTELLGEVVVVAPQTKLCSSTSGGLTYVTTVTSQNRFMDTLRQIIGRNEIKTYPNPVKSGDAINISFNVVETGNYKLELYDASGRLMHASTVAIPSKKYVMNFGSSLPLTSGIYFVKILSAKGKNVYTGSLLVQ